MKTMFARPLGAEAANNRRGTGILPVISGTRCPSHAAEQQTDLRKNSRRFTPSKFLAFCLTFLRVLKFLTGFIFHYLSLFIVLASCLKAVKLLPTRGPVLRRESLGPDKEFLKKHPTIPVLFCSVSRFFFNSNGCYGNGQQILVCVILPKSLEQLQSPNRVAFPS